MDVWFDNVAPNPSSLVNPSSYTTPAAQGQLVLQELLSTQQFLLAVGTDPASPLVPYLKSIDPKATPSTSTLDAEITSTLAGAFSVSVLGGGQQIVRITMTGTNPAYQPGTLNAVADEYVKEISYDMAGRAAAAASVYKTQLANATAQLDAATAKVSDFLKLNPGALPSTNSTLSADEQAVVQDQATVTNIQSLESQSNQSAGGLGSSFRIQDPPRSPIEVSAQKKGLFTVVAGLCGGILITVLAVSGLTALDKTVWDEGDLTAIPNVEVVAVIRTRPRRLRRRLMPTPVVP